jgi:hypothetical protein
MASIVFAFPTVRRINTTIRTGANLPFLLLALGFPALYQSFDISMSLFLAVPSMAGAAPPSAYVFDTSSSWWCLSVDEAALGADECKAVLRLCLVFAEQSIENAIVPVRLGESSGRSGGELLG